MAKKTKQSLGQIVFRLVAGLVFSIIIFWLGMQVIQTGSGAILTNTNNMSALTKYCSDFADSKTKDVQEKNQIAAQCVREKMASPKK